MVLHVGAGVEYQIRLDLASHAQSPSGCMLSHAIPFPYPCTCVAASCTGMVAGGGGTGPAAGEHFLVEIYEMAAGHIADVLG